jgi:hypothetical protein
MVGQEAPLGYRIGDVESNEAFPGEAQVKAKPTLRRMVRK